MANVFAVPVGTCLARLPSAKDSAWTTRAQHADTIIHTKFCFTYARLSYARLSCARLNNARPQSARLNCATLTNARFSCARLLQPSQQDSAVQDSTIQGSAVQDGNARWAVQYSQMQTLDAMALFKKKPFRAFIKMISNHVSKKIFQLRIV